ncbi:BlaI/MecI/CopY family transcriptional regulator [uncultured Dubosiella sp.]|uniref:BlaI/MecI/CopY family transcriptional regulator n=1 Tax=uncultured Dubosiella sp. TaxID=1937011 RepID=UPI0025B2FE3C|nr:hypothetical protein [uncultured Dubosiella sp.]
MKTKPLTKKEEEIMRVFWEQPGPLGLVSLSRVLPEYNLNTMQVVLRKLKNTGFIKPVGVEDNGKTGTRTYAVCMGETDYMALLVDDNQIIPLAAELIQSIPSKRDLDELMELILEKERELEN